MKLKRQVFYYSLLLLLPISVAVRTWELSSAVDRAGFYTQRYHVLCVFLEYVLLLALAAFIVLGRLCLSRDDSPQKPPVRCQALGLASFVMCLCSIPQFFTDIGEIQPNQQGEITLLAVLGAVVPSVVLFVCFLLMGIFQFTGKPIPFAFTVLPVMSEFIRLVMCYAQYNGISQISDNVIHVLYLCSFLAFLLAHSRVYSGIQSGKGIRWAMGTGMAAAVLGMCASLPHLLIGEVTDGMPFVGIGAGLYVLAFIKVMASGGAQSVQFSAEPSVPVTETQNAAVDKKDALDELFPMTAPVAEQPQPAPVEAAAPVAQTSPPVVTSSVVVEEVPVAPVAAEEAPQPKPAPPLTDVDKMFDDIRRELFGGDQ